MYVHRRLNAFESCAKIKAAIDRIGLHRGAHTIVQMASAIVHNSTLLKQDHHSSLFADISLEKVASIDLALRALVEEAVVSSIWCDGVGLAPASDVSRLLVTVLL